MTTKLRPPTLTVHLSAGDIDLIHRFAHRTGASVSQVVMLGVLKLINAVERGEVMPEVLTEFRSGIKPGNA